MVLDSVQGTLWWAWTGNLHAIPKSLRDAPELLSYAPVSFRPFLENNRQKAARVVITFDQWGESGMAGVVRTTPQGLPQITPERELKRSTAKQIHLRVEGEHERGLTGRYRFVTKCLPNGEVVARLVAAIDSLEPSTHPTPEGLDWLERRATYSSVYVDQQHPGRSDHHRRLPRLEEGWAFLRSDQGRAADTLLAPRLEEAFEWLELAGRSGSSAKVVFPLHEFTSIAAPECSNN